jgi:hypothetical protein
MSVAIGTIPPCNTTDQRPSGPVHLLCDPLRNFKTPRRMIFALRTEFSAGTGRRHAPVGRLGVIADNVINIGRVLVTRD